MRVKIQIHSRRNPATCLLTITETKMDETKVASLKDAELKKLKALKKSKCITLVEYKKTKAALLELEGLFDIIPASIHHLFLHECDVTSLCRAFRVCKHWASFNSDKFLKPYVERYFPGATYVQASHLSHSKRKPDCVSWLWVLQSKQPFTDTHFCGIGRKQLQDSPVCPVSYEGEWKMGSKTGFGICNWGDGTVYCGNWLQGKQTGFGKMQWASGSSYEGYWLKGKKHAYGMQIFTTGDKYEGEWYKDVRQGRGTFFYHGNDVYKGEWHDNQRQGKGKYFWANGDCYEGDWKEGNQDGEGKFVWANGDIYEGQYKNDCREGKGIFTWSNKNTYNGDWKDGRRTGFGRFEWANGDVHEGEWLDSKMTGHGVLRWCNGNKYDGQWKDGEKTEGTLYEVATERSFFVKLEDEDEYQPSYLHSSVRKCLAKKRCTYTVTGEKSYFQYLWKTQQHKDGRTRGVCVSCYNTCVPANKIELLEPVKRVFGGNFFCDCGGGFLQNPCLCVPKKSPLYGVSKRPDKEDQQKEQLAKHMNVEIEVEEEKRGNSEKRERHEVEAMEIEADNDNDEEKEAKRAKRKKNGKGKKKAKSKTGEKS